MSKNESGKKSIIRCDERGDLHKETGSMNGAESMLETLINNGVEVCFSNPGTSEMHMVAAIGKSQRMRSILSLFEGVCSGAADGYARMAGKPALTLLHLGPGLSNASANLHNARKAFSPVINLIGDHATYHKRFDAPLNSDVEGLSAPVSHWVKTVPTAAALPAEAGKAVQVAMEKPGRIATLIIPADCAWDESVSPVPALPMPDERLADQAPIDQAAEWLANGRRTTLMMSHGALTEESLALANQIAQATGAKIMCDTFTPRLARGEGRCDIERLGYFAEQATVQLEDAEQLIMVASKPPVGFFAYPGKPSEFYPEGCALHTLCQVEESAEDALRRLVDRVGAGDLAPEQLTLAKPDLVSGPLTLESMARAVGHTLLTDTIIVDESATSGAFMPEMTRNSEPHDWLSLTGGSIGYGLPVAIGAAVASPDRKVLCLHGDGGAMYTIQSLWTMAREDLDVCVVIFANRKYQILQVELARVGAQSMNKQTLDMLDLSNPDIDFVKLSEGMGMRASMATTADEFNHQLAEAMETPGPCLIEAVFV
jgi:acetolactate synthase-1/2/3 large subunit